ncbi:MAG TPA: TonB-dependent receptor plug domain-containing protein [Chitinophagaceae bacterium]|nr:TonB-dependent receptor plug domain-containing protein [Chitinophagaceae bacterium]
MKKLIITAIVLISSIAAFSQTRIAQVKTREQQLNDEYCSGLFSTHDGTYFDMLNDNSALSAQGYFNILDWLQGRVAGLSVYRTRTNEFIPFIRNSRAGIYVDELQVSPGFLNSLAVADIAMIKIIKGPFAGGFNSPGGVIAIYTIRGDDEGEEE